MNNDEDLQKICNEYKKATIASDEAEQETLISKLKMHLPFEKLQSFYGKVNEWKEKCLFFCTKARKMAEKGEGRDSLAFDEVCQEAKKLDPVAELCVKEVFDSESGETQQKVVSQAPIATPVKEEEDAPASPPKKSDVKALLKEIRKKASWSGCDEEVANLKQEMLQIVPRSADKVDKEIAMGKLASKAFTDSYRCGSKHEPQSTFEQRLAEWKKQGLNSAEINKCKAQYKKGGVARQRAIDAQKLSLDDMPSAPNGNVNYIGAMRPSKKWTILFDETGKMFSDDAVMAHKGQMGKGVMLLVPDDEKLPDLEKAWHAVDKSFSEIEGVVRTLLASRCAIIGIPCTAVAKNGKERWFPCIEALLDLVLRCLPVNGETELELLVEQRGDYKKAESKLLDKTCMDSLYHLSKADKSKAEKIKIHGSIIGKDGHAWNGYVDAVAFLWSSSTRGELLERTKWEAKCLLGLSPGVSVERLCSWMDYFHREKALQSEDWSSLLEEVTTQPNQSLLITYLNSLGVQTREDVDLWKQYLDHTVRYLNSKAINMPILSAKISWLKHFMPNEQELPPRLRLLWLTSQLAEENHKGSTKTFEQYREEFRTLSEQLYEEDAPLTCDAALHLAVSYVDQFDFDGAAKLLEPWHGRPAAVPGLQHYGRLLSTYGQHDAFMGNAQAASKHFLEAFSAFGRLSDQDSARSDIFQTNAYLLTVLMDLEQDVSATFKKYAQPYFNGEIKDIAPKLAASTADHEKFQHHILLRYLHSPLATEEEKTAYCSSRANWECGKGHPWEMIEFYRACLCDEPEEKLKHLDAACGMIGNVGGVLHVIATVIAGARMQLRPEGKPEYLRLVEECRVKIPLLGDRLRILQEYAEHPYEPLTLAKQVLPFNFR